MSDDRQIHMRLNNSGKAILIFDEYGGAYMTSVAFMQKLLSNTLPAQFNGTLNAMRLPDTPESIEANNNRWNKGKLIDYGNTDPLSKKGQDTRTYKKVKIDGEW